MLPSAPSTRHEKTDVDMHDVMNVDVGCSSRTKKTQAAVTLPDNQNGLPREDEPVSMPKPNVGTDPGPQLAPRPQSLGDPNVKASELLPIPTRLRDPVPQVLAHVGGGNSATAHRIDQAIKAIHDEYRKLLSTNGEVYSQYNQHARDSARAIASSILDLNRQGNLAAPSHAFANASSRGRGNLSFLLSHKKVKKPRESTMPLLNSRAAAGQYIRNSGGPKRHSPPTHHYPDPSPGSESSPNLQFSPSSLNDSSDTAEADVDTPGDLGRPAKAGIGRNSSDRHKGRDRDHVRPCPSASLPPKPADLDSSNGFGMTVSGIVGKDNKRPWVCNTCGWAFERRSNLRQHMDVHIRRRPFDCPLPWCVDRFSRRNDAVRHVKKVHLQRQELTEADRKCITRAFPTVFY